ncbi:MAG: UvrB/UvrC motif-containing protein, partial [Sulfuricurvum sp.]|nr:UvrB/UvrC motif-containing protein [Sulfuricurvum sp.]
IKKTNDRRAIQEAHNILHGIIPTTTMRTLDENLKLEDVGDLYNRSKKAKTLPAAERKKLVDELSLKMKEAAKKLEFEEAARLRDEIAKIRKL